MKAIEVRDISKIYPLYTNKYDKLKEAILPGNRKFHKDFMHYKIFLLMWKRRMCWNYWIKWIRKINTIKNYNRCYNTNVWCY